MARTTIRKAIGAVKDQTSISVAKVVGKLAPDLEVLVLKATTHNAEPADEKYLREIISLMADSQYYVAACVATVSKRLGKTRNWIVALKALMLVHRLMVDGEPQFTEELVYSTRRGMQILNMSNFRDEAHSNSWDTASFIRVYALYLEEKAELEVLEKKFRVYDDSRKHDFVGRVRSYGELGESSSGVKVKRTPVREMKPKRVLSRLEKLLRILERVLGCMPRGFAKRSRLVLAALYFVLKESFRLYVQICNALNVLSDKFNEMERVDCVKCCDAYVKAAKMIDELSALYKWCKEMGIGRSSEYPQVEKISDVLLSTLEGFMKETETQPPQPVVSEPKRPNSEANQPMTDDLVNLKDNGALDDEQGNSMALALFSGPATIKYEGSWETFSSEEDNELKCGLETPATDVGKADWELALMEAASNLSNQKAELGGELEALMIYGMNDHETVNQYAGTSQLQGESASNVALPAMEDQNTLAGIACARWYDEIDGACGPVNGTTLGPATTEHADG